MKSLMKTEGGWEVEDVLNWPNSAFSPALERVGGWIYPHWFRYAV